MIDKGRSGMTHHPSAGPDPGKSPGTQPQAGGLDIARIPLPNAVTAVIIVVAALAAGITVLIVMPGVLEALGSAVTITGGGFTLAAKIAVPR
ncbi:hypothetical protein [Streptomyces sp. S.PB5]|uniref:hypothetical protein n=1 Tax=Streptomyces sp. S.PB5 TaxID=3020844 RepID=UPI0025AEE10E|nr:hypothetical protein [Streptomyces sp. S.PB5]MDN3028765.1 hypothetical protein [Streptomyces sp. S.PB5]